MAIVRPTGSLSAYEAPALPPTPAARRRVRQWMVLLLLTPVCLGIITLLVFETNGPPEPVVAARTVPAGYRAVTDAYFGYAVPTRWTENVTWTDQNADWFYGTARGFVAETMLVPKHAPTTAAAPPLSFATFGLPDPAPYHLSGGHTVAVPGTAFTWVETLTRADGWTGTAIDTWEPSTTTEVWLLVHARQTTVRAVLASLQGR
jgi:hypothetical protein